MSWRKDGAKMAQSSRRALKREASVTVRFGAKELRQVSQAAERVGLPLAAYLRMLAMREIQGGA
jgi:predicted DNA binding CopG/RHH family protein